MLLAITRISMLMITPVITRRIRVTRILTVVLCCCSSNSNNNKSSSNNSNTANNNSTSIVNNKSELVKLNTIRSQADK